MRLTKGCQYATPRIAGVSSTQTLKAQPHMTRAGVQENSQDSQLFRQTSYCSGLMAASCCSARTTRLRAESRFRPPWRPSSTTVTSATPWPCMNDFQSVMLGLNLYLEALDLSEEVGKDA